MGLFLFSLLQDASWQDTALGFTAVSLNKSHIHHGDRKMTHVAALKTIEKKSMRGQSTPLMLDPTLSES
jgi:hypothetical protein